MSRPLDVLVVESRHGVADAAARSLAAAGHHVATCYDDESRGFPCRGLLDPDACPLAGQPDVALVVRDHVAPRPMPLEGGVVCALRAGLPVVESGPAPLDPYGPWLAARVDGDSDVVAACEAASTAALDALARRIVGLTAPILTGAGVPPGRSRCGVEPDGLGLRVRFALPQAVGTRVRHALAVRVLDAVRGGGRTYGRVDVVIEDLRP
jgi:hypothetical protein